MMESMAAGRRWSVVMRSNQSLPADLVLREFRLEQDYPQVITLWENAGPGIHVRRSDTKGEIAKKLQRDTDLFLVAELDGRVVGTVLGGFDGRRGMVYHLAVEKPFRAFGLGSRLMTELEQRLKQKGCIRCYLLVTQDNLEAIHFYESRGWEKMDILTFGKDLE
jgi:ribosomal protein S18 acetylase RimI-like enzyme